jgi:glycosyltransferase involved in cell wall biosynthesis
MTNTMDPIKFDIFVVTYNRPQLLAYTLQSLVNQTYKNFVVHLVDHGSSPPVNTEKLPKELDIRFERYRTNYIEQHGNDIAEKVLSQLEGDYFMNFADDDILLPNALEIAAGHIQANPNIEIFGGGFLTYDHDNNSSLQSLSYLNRFDGTLSKFDAYKAALKLCSTWGIGPAVDFPIPPISHSSSAFYSVPLIRETKKKQRTIYVRSCGDVGFLGLTLNTDYTYYLNTPLAVIGRSFNQVMNHYAPNNRFKWNDELQYLQHTPVRSCSFQNIGADSHLKVLYALGINKTWDCALRPDFYRNHISYILTDDPWTEKTYEDIEEAMPFFEKSIIKYHNYSEREANTVANNWVESAMEASNKQRKIPKNLEKRDDEKRYGSYKNVLDYADTVMKFMVPRKTDSNTSLFDPGKNKKQTKVIGVWGFYEESFKNNAIFLTPDAPIGDHLLKPMNDFYRVALQNSIELKSLDTIQDFNDVAAFLFWDFPKVDNPLVSRAMISEKPCYLVIAESPVILPDNWLAQNQKHFTKIFTYYDDMIDNKRFFKLNYATDIPSTIHQDIKRKKQFCTMIAGCKYVKHELSLYPHRIDAIKWFEKHHPDDFDLYGIGWNPLEYPSYKGRIKSKLEVLKNYKFSICYENIRDIKGYITEKVFDSLKAGCVPIYWGAKNVSDHIPKGCFIDKRDFPDYESLYAYLKEMNDEDYQKYLKNIEAFFNSEAAYPFTTEAFIRTLLENITNQPIEIFPPQEKSSRQNEETKSKQLPSVAYGSTKPVSRPEGPLVSISMVHYNRLDCLKDCIESIRRHTSGPYELIIIDNGSTDGSPDYLRSLSDITLIEIPSNIRPDLASLKGLAMAKGDYIATISDDIIVTPGWLDLFLEHMNRNPKVGLIGPRSNFVSGAQLVPDVQYRSIQELDTFAEQWTRNFKGNFSNASRLVGFILFFSRELLNKIGGTDPIFRFGFNDDDFTLRAIISGYDAIIADDIFIHHTGGPQMRGDFEYKRKLKESWDAFKTKWGLPPDLEDSDLDTGPILSQKFDPKRHFVPLADPSEVRKLIYRPEGDPSPLQPCSSQNADKIPISFLVTVYNEEERIPYVLESAVKWADEIIVINKSSTDKTKKICLQFGEKVKVVDMPFSHQGDGNMVTYAKIPTHDWIFFSTASEIPTKSLIDRIKEILKDSRGELDLMYVPRKYYSFGIHDKRSPWSISYFPFMVNRKKTVIRDVIHHNFTPGNPENVVKIDYADDCCVYHLTHTTAKGYLHAMTDYFTAEAEECENPAVKIQECMANIAKYDNQLRKGGEDLLGHYFAWQIYWLGTALSVWEKWRGIDVERYYKQLRKNLCQKEWIDNHEAGSAYLKNQTLQPQMSEEGPLVSAIVSVYNAERFIRGCLEDLESQTISHKLEIIVINSASQQNEEAIIKEFQNQYPNIKYFRTEERETVYAAWNRGIKAAAGKYITNANTDDRHVPYAFERMVHVLEKNTDISLVYADVWITENENETFENFTPSGRCRYSWQDFDPKTMIEGCYIGPQPMWRKSVHKKHGYFDETFHSAGDWEFWLRLSQTEKFLHLKETLGLYLKSPTGIENRDPKVSGEEVLRVRQRYGSTHAGSTRDAEKMYQEAQLRINNGMEKDAIKLLLALLERHPDFAIAHNDLGVLYLKGNDELNALKHYEKATELEPENTTFTKNLADFYFVRLSRPEEALELYIKVLSSKPADMEALTAIGHICIGLERYDTAKIFFNRILEADPWNQDVKNIIDQLVNKEGPEEFVQSTEIKNNAETLYRQAQELIGGGRHEEGIGELERLLKIYPDFGLAHNDLGVLYFNQGEKEKAVEHYEHAARVDPLNGTFQKNLADIYFVEVGRTEEALQIYLKLLENNPTDIELLLIMGQICESMDKRKDARLFYTKILEVEPWNKVARKKSIELAAGLPSEDKGWYQDPNLKGIASQKATKTDNDMDIKADKRKEEIRSHSYNSW